MYAPALPHHILVYQNHRPKHLRSDPLVSTVLVPLYVKVIGGKEVRLEDQQPAASSPALDVETEITGNLLLVLPLPSLYFLFNRCVS